MEFGDPELTRRFVWEGLLFQCVQRPLPGSVHAVLDWCYEAVAEGIPLPPIGFVADVGHLVFGEDAPRSEDKPAEPNKTPGDSAPLPSTLVRQYEDLVLGKLYGDRSFDRAVDALRRYADRRDRAKGLAYLLDHLGERAGYCGVHLNPAAIRSLQSREGAEILAKAAESLAEHGPIRMEELGSGLEQTESSLPLMEHLYRDLVLHLRNVGEVLGVEDVFELEHGTAIAGFSQRFALREVLKASAELAQGIPHQPVRPMNRRQQVATQIVDEDTYPIGGFSSISNRGSIESLLHSQLAFMEPDGERPDMFDIKFLRDELLYYSRDENQFLRRRRSFVFALFPDLATARVKDQSRYQRIVLLLGLLRVIVERLTDWLSEDALLFEFVFLKPSGKAAKDQPPLADERELLEMLFREQIANDTVRVIDQASWEEFLERCARRARRSLCNGILLSTKESLRDVENTLTTQLRFDRPVPAVSIDGGEWSILESESDLESWQATLVQSLEAWVAG